MGREGKGEGIWKNENRVEKRKVGKGRMRRGIEQNEKKREKEREGKKGEGKGIWKS